MRVRCEDGWSLKLHRFPAVGERRGAVLCTHAMLADARTFVRGAGRGLAPTLARAGLDVFVADLRGHGRSSRSPKPGQTWTYEDLVDYDHPALVAAVRAESPGPLWAVGHCLGAHSMVASLAAGRVAHPPDGLVHLSGAMWVRELEPSRRRRLMKAGVLGALRLAARPTGFIPARRMGVGVVDEPRSFVDSMVDGWSRGGWCHRDGADFVAGMGNIRGPVLSVVGAGDPLLRTEASTWPWSRAMVASDLSCWRVGPHSGHGVDFAPGHMGLVTDRRCEPLWERIASWILAQEMGVGS